MNMLKKLVKLILPPVLYDSIVYIKNYNRGNYRPEWQVIKNGNLKGRQIYVDASRSSWPREMVEGNYDKFMFDYVQKHDLTDKIVIEIGAHIGYHSMVFSSLVGDGGFVFAFEPNIFNVKRMNKNLERNIDLKGRIKLFNLAVSDTKSETGFYFSDNVDSGGSSGSFLSSAHTFYQKSDNFLNSHSRTTVKTINLDNLHDIIGANIVPFLLKIDVEGAEWSVLTGAKRFLKVYRPIIVMEVHSIFNMFVVSKILQELDYNQILLKEESDGRCFIAAEPYKTEHAEA